MAMRLIIVLARATLGCVAVRVSVEGSHALAGFSSAATFQAQALAPRILGMAVATGLDVALATSPVGGGAALIPTLGMVAFRGAAAKPCQRRVSTALRALSEREAEDQVVREAFAHDRLVDIMAEDTLMMTHVFLQVPYEWAVQFKAGSVRLLDLDLNEEAYAAELMSDACSTVWFKIADTGSATTQREISIMERLCGGRGLAVSGSASRAYSGHIVSYLDQRSIGDKTYILMQGGGRSLLDMIEAELGAECPEGDPSCFHLPLRVSLPLLADILRGLHDLEEIGVVHGALTAQNVILSRADASAPMRAAIAGLAGACAQIGRGKRLASCATLADNQIDFFATSPFSQPPQVRDGSPTGPADHAWSAGMLLAQMLFSYNPLEEAILSKYPTASISEFDPLDRRFIREFVAEQFAIQNDPVFAAMPPDVQRLLAGMLELEESKRWTTAAALAQVEKVAKAHNIAIADRLLAAERPDP